MLMKKELVKLPISPSLQAAATKDLPVSWSAATAAGSARIRVRAAAASSKAELKNEKIKNCAN